MKKQKDNLSKRLDRERVSSEGDSNLALLSQQVLNLFGEHDHLTISQIEELTGANKNTLKVRLRKGVRKDVLKIEKQIDLFLDQIVEFSSRITINDYECKIAALAGKKESS